MYGISYDRKKFYDTGPRHAGGEGSHLNVVAEGRLGDRLNFSGMRPRHDHLQVRLFMLDRLETGSL